MHRALTSLATAAAALGSAHGLPDSAWGAIADEGPEGILAVRGDTPSTEKFIGGVPVLNYERAYEGKAYAAVEASARTEDWIVMLKSEATDRHIGELCARAGRGCFQKGQQGGIPFVALHGTEEELAFAVKEHSSLAQYIQPDQLMWVDPVEEAPQARAPSGQNELIWGLQRVGADKRSYEGRGVHVYVADTGIRVAHEEFGGRAFPFVDVFIDTNESTGLCTDAEDPECSTDRHGHGTHCAGTVAGQHWGVAPQAMVHAVKVLSDAGPGSTVGIILGMNHVGMTGQRPAIISMSLGGSGQNPSYKTAIDELTGNLGITVVVAAGNDYNDACTKSPAYVPSAITVGATASDDTRSGFSNFGTCVDFWAPGTDILSADGRVGSHGSNTGNWTISGTSMACPHVSGGVALLLEADPTMVPTAVLQRLLNDSSVNYITDLSGVDVNNLLYVGNDGPEEPQEAPVISWPPTEFFASCALRDQAGPRGDYPVCQCSDRNSDRVNGSRCFNGITLGCPIGDAMDALDATTPTELTWFYSLWNCTDCRCYARGEEPWEITTTTAPEVPVDDVAVAAGLHFSFFIEAETGRAMAMGRNSYGQLGVGDMRDRGTPTEVMLPEGRVREVSAGRYHSLFLMESGEVFVAGRNHHGQLGRAGGSAATPEPLTLLAGPTAVDVATGHGHSLVLLASGSVLSTGCNNQGQLGDGTMEDKSALTAVVGIQDATSVTAGFDFSYFLTQAGEVYATGNNLGGQLGDNTRMTKHTPVMVLSGVQGVRAGSAHALFHMEDGSVRGTGANFAGQLGTGDNQMQAAPVQVQSATDAERVTAGGDCSSYVGQAVGMLNAFGSNRYGQLGLGDVQSTNTPTQVAGLDGRVLNEAFGESHSVLVTWVGKVYTSGANQYGELGDNTTIAKRTPVEIFTMRIPGATTTEATTVTTVATTTTEPEEGGVTTTVNRAPSGGVPQGVYYVIGLGAVGGLGALGYFAMSSGPRPQGEGAELVNTESTEP